MTVDFCMSLGGSCSAAIQLRRRGLRVASLPFDWLIHQGERTMEWPLRLTKAGGGGWLDRPVLLTEEELYKGENLGRWQYRDLDSGFDLLHDFLCDIEKEPKFLADVKGVYARRFARLGEWLKNAREALLVLDVDYPVTDERLRELKVEWEKAFPQVKFRLFAVLWAQERDEEFEEDGLVVRRARRPKHRYDNEATTPVWDWLDEVKLSGRLGADDGRNSVRMPLFYRLLRIMFLGSRKLLRQGGWLAGVE